MALDLTAEQKALGRENMTRAADGLTRRGFMKSMVVAGAAVVPVSTAIYYGYNHLEGKPVKVGLIGGGDEGGVLVGEHNPKFLEFIAVADIRPTNMERIFQGDKKAAIRKGFNSIYGNDAKKIQHYTEYQKLLANKDVEAVIIALPLHLHAPVAIEAMRAGKHVLCEKLMGWNIQQCKKMIKVAKETNRILSIGHQRHYSMLYAHATEIINAGVLGDIKHIRALWHRNNSWPWVDDSADPTNGNREMNGPLAKEQTLPYYRDSWFNPVYAKDYDALNPTIKSNYDYNSVEELMRWRLYNQTGGGLMAELGSHQLDACSIFLGHVHPLAVTAVGGKYFYGPGRNDRECDDHVFVTYEFPGKDHPKGPARPDGSHGKNEDDIVVVTYSSVNTNSFENYGECVMGTHGTMIVEAEQSVMLFSERDPSKAMGPPRGTAVTVSAAAKDKPVLDTSSSPVGSVAAGPGGTTAPSGPPSRGYREEMEDFACCVRTWDKEHRLPRCHGEVAMADAIIALTANHAMRRRERIVFDEKWFDPQTPDVPDDPSAKPRFDVERL